MFKNKQIINGEWHFIFIYYIIKGISVQVLKKWLDIEQSSSSSQADSSEEGVPVQEERAVEGTVAEEGGVVEEGGVAVETSVAGEEDAAEEGNIVEEGTEESVPGEQSPPLPETETDVNVLEVGHLLLNQWNSLKEVFKIPKKDKAPPSMLNYITHV